MIRTAAACGAVLLGLGLLKRRVRAVEVAGESMLPALRPGDWLLVWTPGRPAPGDAVVARHPERPELLIVKRAARRERDGWWLESDNQRAPGRSDSWDFGAVPDDLVIGRVAARYRPLSRVAVGGRAVTRATGGWQAAVARGRPAQCSEQ
ncbi:nickel-type superoxide dismutase maturation protease [Spirillospora albida]|uniref:nickel-type superoxide dismutase maturation protease n=1 Tax=Spirillospora albida TaxID=58123 RepID=UPI000B1DB7BE|nr:nickel-type superoxide dismutase maturation protease [Spirillospora albida]